MKCTLILLAALVGAVCGTELGAEIRGVTTSESYCTPEQEYVLYKECVEDVAVSLGVVLSRRLELRGSGRKLPVCSQCEPEMFVQGHWCFTYCSARRRLAVADEHVHTERFLVSKGQIQQGANACLDLKIQEGYTCLGNPGDLRIKIFLSEE
jgi:hypothetical protein